MRFSHLMVYCVCVLYIRRCHAKDIPTDGSSQNCSLSTQCVVATYFLPVGFTAPCPEAFLPGNISNITLRLSIKGCFPNNDDISTPGWLFLRPWKWISQCWNKWSCQVQITPLDGKMQVGVLVCFQGDDPAWVIISVYDRHISGAAGPEFFKDFFRISVSKKTVQDLNFFKNKVPAHFFIRLQKTVQWLHNRRHKRFSAFGRRHGRYDSFLGLGSSPISEETDQVDDSLWTDQNDISANLGVMHFGDDYLDGIPDKRRKPKTWMHNKKSRRIKGKHIKLKDSWNKLQKKRLRKPLSKQRKPLHVQNKHGKITPQQQKGSLKAKQKPAVKNKVVKQKVKSTSSAAKAASKSPKDALSIEIGTYPLSLNDGTNSRAEGKLSIYTKQNTANLASDLEEKMRTSLAKLINGKKIEPLPSKYLDADMDAGRSAIADVLQLDSDMIDSDSIDSEEFNEELEAMRKSLTPKPTTSKPQQQINIQLPPLQTDGQQPPLQKNIQSQTSIQPPPSKTSDPSASSQTHTQSSASQENVQSVIKVQNGSRPPVLILPQMPPERPALESAATLLANDTVAQQLHDMVMKNISKSMSNLKLTEANIMRAENILLGSMQGLKNNLHRLIYKTSPRMQKKLLRQLEASMRNATYAAAWTLINQLLRESQQQAQSLGLDWYEWGQWSQCSAHCSSMGYKLRRRGCKSAGTCRGPSFDLEACTNPIACAAKWMTWSTWGKCSTTCGEGQRTRTRICLSTEPGMSCDGDAVDSSFCPSHPACPKARTKDKLQLVAQKVSHHHHHKTGHPMNTDKLKATSVVSQEPPPYPGENQWSPWGVWSLCSVTCGPGKQERKRTCTRLAGNSLEGQPIRSKLCEGSPVAKRVCNTEPCSHPVAVKSNLLSAEEGSTAKLVCNYTGKLPVKEVYWINPMGERISKKTQDERYTLINNTLIITNVQATDLGPYHCILIGENEESADQALAVRTCANLPCKHGGICEEVQDSKYEGAFHFRCICKDGFYGRHCEQKFIVSEHMPWLKLLAVVLLVLILILVIVSISMCLYYKIHDRRNKETSFIPIPRRRSEDIWRKMKPFNRADEWAQKKSNSHFWNPMRRRTRSMERSSDQHVRFGMEESPYNALFTSLVNDDENREDTAEHDYIYDESTESPYHSHYNSLVNADDTGAEVTERDYNNFDDERLISNLHHPSVLEEEVMDLLEDETHLRPHPPVYGVNTSWSHNASRNVASSQTQPPPKLHVLPSTHTALDHPINPTVNSVSALSSGNVLTAPRSGRTPNQCQNLLPSSNSFTRATTPSCANQRRPQTRSSCKIEVSTHCPTSMNKLQSGPCRTQIGLPPATNMNRFPGQPSLHTSRVMLQSKTRLQTSLHQNQSSPPKTLVTAQSSVNSKRFQDQPSSSRSWVPSKGNRNLNSLQNKPSSSKKHVPLQSNSNLNHHQSPPSSSQTQTPSQSNAPLNQPQNQSPENNEEPSTSYNHSQPSSSKTQSNTSLNWLRNRSFEIWSQASASWNRLRSQPSDVSMTDLTPGSSATDDSASSLDSVLNKTEPPRSKLAWQQGSESKINPDCASGSDSSLLQESSSERLGVTNHVRDSGSQTFRVSSDSIDAGSPSARSSIAGKSSMQSHGGKSDKQPSTSRGVTESITRLRELRRRASHMERGCMQSMVHDDRFPFATRRQSYMDRFVFPSTRSRQQSRLVDTSEETSAENTPSGTSADSRSASDTQRHLEGGGEGGVSSVRPDPQKSPRDVLLRRAMENSFIRATSGFGSSRSPSFPVQSLAQRTARSRQYDGESSVFQLKRDEKRGSFRRKEESLETEKSNEFRMQQNVSSPVGTSKREDHKSLTNLTPATDTCERSLGMRRSSIIDEIRRRRKAKAEEAARTHSAHQLATRKPKSKPALNSPVPDSDDHLLACRTVGGVKLPVVKQPADSSEDTDSSIYIIRRNAKRRLFSAGHLSPTISSPQLGGKVPTKVSVTRVPGMWDLGRNLGISKESPSSSRNQNQEDDLKKQHENSGSPSWTSPAPSFSSIPSTQMFNPATDVSTSSSNLTDSMTVIEDKCFLARDSKDSSGDRQNKDDSHLPTSNDIHIVISASVSKKQTDQPGCREKYMEKPGSSRSKDIYRQQRPSTSITGLKSLLKHTSSRDAAEGVVPIPGRRVSFGHMNVQEFERSREEVDAAFEEISQRTDGPLATERQFDAIGLRSEGPLAVERQFDEIGRRPWGPLSSIHEEREECAYESASVRSSHNPYDSREPLGEGMPSECRVSSEVAGLSDAIAGQVSSFENSFQQNSDASWHPGKILKRRIAERKERCNMAHGTQGSRGKLGRRECYQSPQPSPCSSMKSEKDKMQHLMTDAGTSSASRSGLLRYISREEDRENRQDQVQLDCNQEQESMTPQQLTPNESSNVAASTSDCVSQTAMPRESFLRMLAARRPNSFFKPISKSNTSNSYPS